MSYSEQYKINPGIFSEYCGTIMFRQNHNNTQRHFTGTNHQSRHHEHSLKKPQQQGTAENWIRNSPETIPE